MKIGDIIPDKYSKSIRELFVIFISIVLAFLFDDYRENKNQNGEYKKTLVNFTDELVDDIDSRRNHLDSFRVDSDNILRGQDLERLLDLIWFESKIDNKKATMADFEYLIKSEHLSADISGYGPSPLSEELRTKFGEQITNRHLVKWLRIYEEEMKTLLKVDQASSDSHELIDRIIEKTNPNYKFTIKDSLLIFSNEFIWRYKNIVTLRRATYHYEKWLVQERLKRVYGELFKELESQGLSLVEYKCTTIDNFNLRFECENGRLISGDSLISIAEIVEMKRIKYMQKRAAHNNVHEP